MITGTFTDGKSSQASDCDLSYTETGTLSFSLKHLPALRFEQVKISSRIADTARYITLPDGAVFETTDNDAIDRLVDALSQRNLDFAHRLESSLPFIFATVIFVVVFGWAFIKFGIPALSEEIAFLIPEEQTRLLGRDVLSSMDETIFDDSELSAEQQQHYTMLFSGLLDALDRHNITIAFRKSDAIGANAFALPDGTVVFTDEMIAIARHDDEIASIMLHEIGHIENRHSLRIAIQSFSLAVFIAIITGDVSTSSTIITGLPAVLIESGYSRRMETEADSYALQHMQQLNLDPAHFADIMSRLQASQDKTYTNCMKESAAADDCLKDFQQKQQQETSLSGYFSSHPGTAERILRFRQHAH